MGVIDDEDPQLFRRSGIIAAFDSLERAKKLVDWKRKNTKFYLKFSYFDELLTPFSSTYLQTRFSITNRKSSRGFNRQTSFDSSAIQKSRAQVK